MKTGKLYIPQAAEIDTVVELFKGIYGVGDTIATNWYNKGWRSLKDVKDHNEELTHDQKLGLKYYTEINSKIDREEMIKLENAVSENVKKIDKDYLVYLVGSFRRGELECGDADFIGKLGICILFK